MKRLIPIILAAVLVLSACGTASPAETEAPAAETAAFSITDYNGNTVSFEACPTRVAACIASFGEIWLNAGGTLVGVTDDAVSERGIELGPDVTFVGTVKDPNLEMLISLEPEYVILSADTASHADVAKALGEVGIPYGMFHVEYFEDYLALLKSFTDITGRDDLYKQNGTDVGEKIEAVLKDSEKFEGKTALLLRAYSSGWKAKSSETLCGAIIADFGFENIVDKYDTELEEISLEEIAAADPDYIFVTIMGSDVAGTTAMLKEKLESSPVWSALTSVQEGHYFILPQDLFHFKPNARWGESYEYMSELLNK